MEAKQKTWDDYCNEAALNEGFVFGSRDSRIYQKAAELYNQDTAKERDRLKEELNGLKNENILLRHRKTRLEESISLMIKNRHDAKIKHSQEFNKHKKRHQEAYDSLKEENERLKETVSRFTQSFSDLEKQERDLKQLNSELVSKFEFFINRVSTIDNNVFRFVTLIEAEEIESLIESQTTLR